MAQTNLSNHPIDAVILWVDGNDPNHKEKIRPFVKDKASITTKKFRTRFDQVNEIQYTINSILKFASYIRHVYIITDNQIPEFLKSETAKENYKKVSIVDHTVIFKGYEQYLPTFNCRPIETLLHRIPNLAEHFIYFNDDFFLINETKPTDFFTNGHPILRGKWLKFDSDIFYKKFKKPKFGHKAAQQKAAQLAGFTKYYNFRHTPHPMRRSTFANYFKDNEAVLIENIKHKFRKKTQFTPQGLANHLEIKNKTCTFKSDLQLLYFRSYKKSMWWYKYKLNTKSKGKLFLGLQSLDYCPPDILKFILNWLDKRINT